MPIVINTKVIHASYAQVLREIDPNADVFDNPNQQGTAYPAWFIVHRAPVERLKEIGRYTLVYQIDIWYMLQQNITCLYDKYTLIAEQLQEKLEYLPIFGHEGVVVHTYDMSWGLELNALKFSTTLRLRCSRDKTPDEYMQVIERLDVFIKMAFPLIRVYFTNVSHPELDIEIPNQMFCYYGDTMVLPTIEGIYRDAENHRWQPVGWTLGGFGETIGPLYANTTTNLILERVYGYEAPMGGIIGDKSSTSNFVKIVEMEPNYEPDYRHTGILSIDGVETGNADMVLIHEPDYAYSGTVTNEPMVFGGTVEPWTPPATDKTAYFTNKGSSGTSDTNITFSTYQMYDSNGSIILSDSNHTYTLVKIYDYSGNEVTIPSSVVYSLYNNSGTLCMSFSPTSFYAYKITYIEEEA